MTYVVVIAKPGSGQAPRIYRGKTVTTILNRIRQIYIRDTIGWTAEMDAFVRANYRRMGATAVAKELHVTKNAVIGRYHRIKGGQNGT